MPGEDTGTSGGALKVGTPTLGCRAWVVTCLSSVYPALKSPRSGGIRLLGGCTRFISGSPEPQLDILITVNEVVSEGTTQAGSQWDLAPEEASKLSVLTCTGPAHCADRFCSKWAASQPGPATLCGGSTARALGREQPHQDLFYCWNEVLIPLLTYTLLLVRGFDEPGENLSTSPIEYMAFSTAL